LNETLPGRPEVNVRRPCKRCGSPVLVEHLDGRKMCLDVTECDERFARMATYGRQLAEMSGHGFDEEE